MDICSFRTYAAERLRTRNDNYFTLAPFVAALGYKIAVIARNEAIFRCLFAYEPTDNLAEHRLHPYSLRANIRPIRFR